MATRAAKRINARLDDDLARRVELVRKRKRRTVSQIVQESLARYCDQELGEGERPLTILRAAGFVGCADGPVSLSSDYKQELARLLRRKT